VSVKNALFFRQATFEKCWKELNGMTQNSFNTDFLISLPVEAQAKKNLLHHDIKLSIFKKG